MAGVFAASTAASPDPQASKTAGQPSEQGLQIEIKAVARVPHVNARYALVKKIPEADYQPWHPGAGFVSQNIFGPIPKDLGSLVELLVIARNTGIEELKLENKDMKLTVSGRSMEPWEYLFADVYMSYEGLARRLSVSEGSHQQESEYMSNNFFGSCYSRLKSGEQTWLVLIYRVPEKNIYGKLSLGASSPITVKLP
jgi:hypothetical protein